MGTTSGAAEEPVEGPVEGPAEEPVEEPVEGPMEGPAEEPVVAGLNFAGRGRPAMNSSHMNPIFSEPTASRS